jgi:hypothetical protein
MTVTWRFPPEVEALRHPYGSLERMILEDEAARERAAEAQWWLNRAWDRWAIASCEERGGHWWHLDIDPDEGVSFGCLYCPADAGTLVPDGYELLTGTFEVTPGYRLTLDMGDVVVNDRWQDRHRASWENGLDITYGWKGPVTASVRVEKYGGHVEPAEYDVWIDLAPVPGASTPGVP